MSLASPFTSTFAEGEDGEEEGEEEEEGDE